MRFSINQIQARLKGSSLSQPQIQEVVNALRLPNYVIVKEHLMEFGFINKVNNLGVDNVKESVYKLRYWHGMDIETIHTGKGKNETKYILR